LVKRGPNKIYNSFVLLFTVLLVCSILMITLAPVLKHAQATYGGEDEGDDGHGGMGEDATGDDGHGGMGEDATGNPGHGVEDSINGFGDDISIVDKIIYQVNTQQILEYKTKTLENLQTFKLIYQVNTQQILEYKTKTLEMI
jgi:hypothetical protein